MRLMLITVFFSVLQLSSIAQSQFKPEELCDKLDDLVNEVIPESFKDVPFELASISEVEDSQEYNKVNYPFLGLEYLYFIEEGEPNKRLVTYPLITVEREEALQTYIAIKEAFDQCELVYTSVRQEPNPNIGMLAYYTIGIDRRFYNSTLKLFQYVSDVEQKYWIEFEMIAPKQQ